ncbi:MAG: hypothetical protein IH851_02825 [Armatimonadetes bacterium]|nr:hypothetical protein [Armatimonadota bacterium]
MNDEVIRAQLREVAKACVPLVLHREELPAEQRLVCYSGFLVELANKWIWITAGHVIDELDAVLGQEPSPSFFFRVPTDPNGPVFFNYTDAKHASFLAVSKIGMKLRPRPARRVAEAWQYLAKADIGFAVLTTLYIDNLRAAGAVPFDKDQIRHYGEEEVKGIDVGQLGVFLAGIPAESKEADLTADNPTISFKELPLHPASPDECEPPQCYFEPQWTDDLHEGDVKGMSGGPIVVLGLDKPLVVAVQSAQLSVPGRTPRRVIGIESPSVLSLVGELANRE